MFKDAKIYVAGHRGLLGSALVEKLAAEGYTRIITRTRRELDLTRQRPVDDFFSRERPEYVFLCAGLTGGILANKTSPATFLQTNVLIQSAVFDAAQRYGVKHLVFYGSSCVYPKISPQPMKEEYFLSGGIEETSEAYAAAKIAGIIACRAFNRQYGTNRFIALLPNSMYGPYDTFDAENSHVLSALIRRFHDAKQSDDRSVMLWGSGAPRREFIFSGDVADASILAVKYADRLENCHYNLGTGIDHSIKELAELIAGIVGFTGEITWDTTKPDGAMQKLLDSSRFLALGWKPSTSLRQGLEATYQWYRDHFDQTRR